MREDLGSAHKSPPTPHITITRIVKGDGTWNHFYELGSINIKV